MKIIVPATSANIGPGFDSVGVAVTKYLQIEVCEERDEWLIEHQIGKWIPHDERNLLLKIALQIALLGLNWLTNWAISTYLTTTNCSWLPRLKDILTM